MNFIGNIMNERSCFATAVKMNTGWFLKIIGWKNYLYLFIDDFSLFGFRASKVGLTLNMSFQWLFCLFVTEKIFLRNFCKSFQEKLCGQLRLKGSSQKFSSRGYKSKTNHNVTADYLQVIEFSGQKNVQSAKTRFYIHISRWKSCCHWINIGKVRQCAHSRCSRQTNRPKRTGNIILHQLIPRNLKDIQKQKYKIKIW